MSEVLDIVIYKGHRLAHCRCSCGNLFHCFSEEFQKPVQTCGHLRAGNLLDRLVSLRESERGHEF